MNYKVEIFPSKYLKFPGKKLEWYIRLASAANNETLNTSEGYVSKWNAKRAARKVYPMFPITIINTDGTETIVR